MPDLAILQERLTSELGRFLLTIQTVREVDAAAFDRIDRDAAELARALKGQPLVPKSLLNELRVATKIMWAEAAYIEGGKSALPEMAGRLEMTFDLILRNECHDDRVPGVPRIV